MGVYIFGIDVMFRDLTGYVFELFNKPMIVYQEDIQVGPKLTISSVDLIGGRVYMTALFDLYAIAMYVADLNPQDKNIKGGYDPYHHLKEDGETFL